MPFLSRKYFISGELKGLRRLPVDVNALIDASHAANRSSQEDPLMELTTSSYRMAFDNVRSGIIGVLPTYMYMLIP